MGTTAPPCKFGMAWPLSATADFFTPVVDDPYDWGRIAAANALSDVYAMGGRPVVAVNLLCWPRELLPMELAPMSVAARRPERGPCGECWRPSTPVR